MNIYSRDNSEAEFVQDENVSLFLTLRKDLILLVSGDAANPKVEVVAKNIPVPLRCTPQFISALTGSNQEKMKAQVLWQEATETMA